MIFSVFLCALETLTSAWQMTSALDLICKSKQSQYTQIIPTEKLTLMWLFFTPKVSKFHQRFPHSFNQSASQTKAAPTGMSMPGMKCNLWASQFFYSAPKVI